MTSTGLPSTPRFLLVMTATMTPAANAQVKRSSPHMRLEDYKRALRYWLSYPHPAAERILFLENSGADLSELRAGAPALAASIGRFEGSEKIFCRGVIISRMGTSSNSKARC